MIGRHLIQSDPKKTTQGQRICRPPRNPALALQPFEIPDQYQTEVPPGRQTRPSHPLRIEARTLVLHPFIKTTRLQHSVQLFIERMRNRPRQFRVRDPKLLLLAQLILPSHRHVRIVGATPVDS